MGNNFFNRLIGIFKLDVKTYEEVEADEGATMQALIVVTLVALLGVIGNVIANMIAGGTNLIGSILTTLIGSYLGWAAWAVISWFVGTNFFGGKATIQEMLRVIGFAQAPLLLGIVPCIGGLVGWVWSLATGFIAIRQGLDLDNTKAFLTVLIGFVVSFAITFILGLIFGGGMMALNSLMPAQ
jgi:hypothetical protein